MHWFYPYRSFKHSRRWRHKSGLHIEYLTPTYYILVLIFVVEIDKKSLAITVGFNTIK